MALLPSPPTRQTSFTDYATSYPGQPPPGDKLDAEFDRINLVLAALIPFVGSMFASDGTLRSQTVPRTALALDVQFTLAELDAAAATLTNQNALKWAEYLAGPVADPSQAPAVIASSNVPSGLFYDPVAGSPGGLFSAKYWAIQAQAAVLAFTTAYGAPSPPPFVQIVRLQPWTFNNVATAFALARQDTGAAITPDQNALLVSLNGYLQTPGTDFTVAGSTITFASAPYATEPHFAVWLAAQAPTSTATGNLDGGTF